jgi:hypothetical protein
MDYLKRGFVLLEPGPFIFWWWLYLRNGLLEPKKVERLTPWDSLQLMNDYLARLAPSGQRNRSVPTRDHLVCFGVAALRFRVCMRAPRLGSAENR